jgi:FMN phosphatase YigB (HAD superfamily)
MELPHKSVFTFDVFDTFLLRRCTAPDGVFERAFHYLPIAATRPGLIESFVQSRILAELSARQKAVDIRQSGEVTIEEIYCCLPRHVLDLEGVSVADLVAAELRAEIDLCIVNPEMLELFEEARSGPRRLRVGFISDTYWAMAQLREILLSCVPDLAPDFIYTSSDHRTSKMATLFDKVMHGEYYAGIDAIHIGDNTIADILGARAFNISAVHYPQPQEPIAHLIAREGLAIQLMQSKRPDLSQRLDQGFHLVRRMTVSKLPGLPAEFRDGAAIFGPVLAGFQRFLKHRIDKVSAGGGKVAVLFLGRDGYLPFELWQESQDVPARYLEINRRVALIANLREIKPLQDIIGAAWALNEASVQALLKVDLPSVKAYFAGIPSGQVDGKTFAAALPKLLDEEDVTLLSDLIRDQFMDYLNASLPELDSYTDLILVDLGYNGTIQRSLRGVFTRCGMKQRLHGVYLTTVDGSFVDLPEGDSAAGYIDSSVVPPSTKLFLLRNIAIIEQMFSAPHGSVRYYENGEARREPEIRPEAQHLFCAQLREAAKLFAKLFDASAAELKIDLDLAIRNLRDWSAILLLRLMAFPTLAEQQSYGTLKHDVNLGTYLLFDMADADHVERQQHARGMPGAMASEAPPMWVGGSMAGISALHACAYGMGAFGLSTAVLLRDQTATQVAAAIISNGKTVTCEVGCLVTATGELRMHFPVLQRQAGGTIALPLAGFLQRGLIRGLTVQRGRNSDAAMKSQMVEVIDGRDLQSLQCRLDGQQFTALGQDAHLLIPIPASTEAVTVITITVLPLPPADLGGVAPGQTDIKAIA